MFKAQGFNVEYGSNICAKRLDSIGEYVLITHLEPWAFLKDKVKNQPIEIVEAKNLSKAYLDELANRIPAVHIVGLGGVLRWTPPSGYIGAGNYPSLKSLQSHQ